MSQPLIQQTLIFESLCTFILNFNGTLTTIKLCPLFLVNNNPFSPIVVSQVQLSFKGNQHCPALFAWPC